MRLILLSAVLFFTFSGVHAQEQPVVKGKKGIASYYHDKFVGRPTATGEIFSNDKFTAASNKLNLNTYVKVTNLENHKVVYVRINDRMAPTNKRLIDLASIAADELGFKDDGIAKVKVEIVPAEEGRIGILAQNYMKDQPTKNQL